MNDTISREAVADAINGIECTRQTTWYEFYQKVMTAVEKLQPAEPKSGKWIYKNDLITVPTGYWECSECKEGRLLYEANFCPNCGADMREVTE